MLSGEVYTQIADGVKGEAAEKSWEQAGDEPVCPLPTFADKLTARQRMRGGLKSNGGGVGAAEPPEIPKLPRVVLSLRPGAA